MGKYLSIVNLMFLLCFAVACQDKAATAELEEFKAQKALEEANKALVMRYFGAVESGDLEAVKEIFSPDCILHHTTGQDWSLEKTIETVKKQNEQSKVMFPDVTFINEDTIVNGDKAVLTCKESWRSSRKQCKLKSSWQQIPPLRKGRNSLLNWSMRFRRSVSLTWDGALRKPGLSWE